MQTIQITHRIDNTVLFSGNFPCLKSCLETAVAQKICLSYADLRFANLANAQLDEARMESADFSFSNLSGANLSEAHLHNTVFYNCDLFNVCFAYSDLSDCNFSYASFGGTNIVGANLSRASFASLSCFSLSFIQAHTMQSCFYTTADGHKRSMNTPPVVIQGLSDKPIIIFEDSAYAGDDILHDQNFLALLKIQSSSE